MHKKKLVHVALQIVRLLAREPGLRQAEIACRLGECKSTILRALPYTETVGARLAEDEQGRLWVAES